MQSSNSKPISSSCVVTVSVTLQALACAAVLVHAVPAAAQGDGKAAPHGLSGSLGVGVVNTTTYEGGAKRRTVVGPDVSVSYRTKDWGSVELGQRRLVWQALEAGDLMLGLAAAIDPGRKTKESSTGDPTPGDRRRAGMGDVRASAEAGVLVGYGPVSLLARKSVGDRGHQGAQMDLSAEFPFALTDTVGVRFGAWLQLGRQALHASLLRRDIGSGPGLWLSHLHPQGRRSQVQSQLRRRVRMRQGLEDPRRAGVVQAGW